MDKYNYFCSFIFCFCVLIITTNFQSVVARAGNSTKNGTKPFLGGIESVKFYSYSDPSNDQAGTEIQIGNISSLAVAGLIPGKPVKIMIHGLAGSVKIPTETCRLLVPKYLKKGFPNLICVDWSKLSGNKLPLGFIIYTKVLTENVPRVGKRVAEFIQFLINEAIVPQPKLVHVLGSGIGAHVSGSTGNQFKEMTGKQLGRITGFDLTGPLLSFGMPRTLLEPSSAIFVDVLHSDIGAMGSPKSYGCADFFANGGKSENQLICQIPMLVSVGPLSFGCGHFLATTYYARTIKGEIFTGCKCVKSKLELFGTTCSKAFNGSCLQPARFGEYGDLSARGNYYLDVPPFALPHRPQ